MKKRIMRNEILQISLARKLLMVMKITFILLLVGLMQVSASTYSQNTKLTLNLKNVKMTDLFEEIEKNSEFRFFYDSSEIDLLQKVTVDLKKSKIEQILNAAFLETGLSYELIDRHIIVKNTRSNTTFGEISEAQQKSVTGKVTDESGDPLPGVTILIKGTTNGTVTNMNGNYSITNIPENATLVFSFIGMVTQEVSVGTQTTINTTMQVDAIGIEEVIAIGYGTQKKVNLTGSVVSINSEQIESRPATNISTVLAGQMPGLSVIQKSGKPGDNSGTLRIRGIGTLGNSNPLVMVDGVESSMQNVDINDIANVSVLKDAASSAIYGVRAANGVILITTKKGKIGLPVLKYHGGVGTLEPFKMPDRVDAYGYATMYNQANINDGTTPRYTDDDLNKWKTGSSPITHANNDQFTRLLETGDPLRHFHNLSLSGGSDATQYYMSLGYNREGGLIATHGYERWNYRVNVTQKITDKLTAGVNLAGSFAKKEENSQSAGQLITEAYRAHPGGHIFYEDKGYWADGRMWGGTRNMESYVSAPLGSNNRFYYDYVNTIFAEYELLPDFKLRAQFTANNSNLKRRYNRQQLLLWNYLSSTDEYKVVTDIDMRKYREARFKWDLTSQLLATYSKTFGKHNINALAGYEQRKISEEYFEAGRKYVRGLNEIVELGGIPDANDVTNGWVHDYRIRSGFSRINYNFDEKYLFEANVRYDGTSRFPKESRFAIFPSFSVGWRLSEEEFFTSELFDNIKIRASWGQLGNQEIGNYAFLPVYDQNTKNNYAFGNTVYNSRVEKSPLANVEIGWETTTVSNLGIDATMLDGKLSVSGEYFIKTTDDILLALPQPSILGARPPVLNAGSVENKGFEVAINHQNKVGNDFNYYVNANIAYVKNEITDLKGADKPGRSVGDPINNIFGYVADGIFQNQAEIDAAPDQTVFGGDPVPGDVRYVDNNGRGADGELTGKPDGKVDANDRKSLGTNFPKYSFGLTAGFNWKNFDFSMVWQGFTGVQALTQGPIVRPFNGGARPLTDMVDNFWTDSNKNADFPRLTLKKSGRNYQKSSFWMNDGSFAKLRNLQIGYTLPSSVLNTLKLEKIRIYVSGENLLHISGFKNIDPEFAHGNPAAWSNSNYPSSRLYLAGINVTF